jgi:uncharacterized membrane protein
VTRALRWASRLALGFILAGAGTLQAQDIVLGRALAQEVRELFRQTCLDCHGEDLAKPKGDFGYVLDLARIAANPDLIVPGKPDESEIYLLIRDDEMPGEDSDVGNLTDLQKELVRRWIELGAPSPEIAAAGTVTPAEPPARASRLSATERTVRWLGEFHPASVHFPIALMVVAALAQFWGLAQACLLCLRVSALTTPLAAAIGWAHAEFASYTSKSALLLEWHRWLGVAAAVAALLAWALVRRGGAPYKLALYGGVALVLAAGALGGGLVHGWDHYRW